MTMQRKIYQGVPVIMDDPRVDPTRMAKAWVKDGMREIRASMLSMASANQPGEKGWYVLQIASGREKSVENVLREKNVLAYLPLVPGGTAIIRGRKVQRLDRPALPGYLMVSVAPSPAAFAGLARVRGVDGMLGGAEHPHRVSDEIMSRFKIKIGDLAEMAAHAREFKKGDWVEFEEGPFTGLKGHIVRVQKMVLIRGEKPVAIKGEVDVEIAGRLTRVFTPLALLAKV